jgi:hypothetical protein
MAFTGSLPRRVDASVVEHRAASAAAGAYGVRRKPPAVRSGAGT